jgi:beta-lactamase class A
MQFVDGVRPNRVGGAILRLEPKLERPQPVIRPVTRTFSDIRRPSLPGAVMLEPTLPEIMQPLLTPSATNIMEALPSSDNRPLRWAAVGVASLSLVLTAAVIISRLNQPTTSVAATATNALPQTQTSAPAASAKAEPAPTAPLATEHVAAQSAQLQSILNQFSTGVPTGLVVKDLKSGAVASKAGDQVFTSASLYKLFVAHGIYKMIDSGQRRLSDSVGGLTIDQCLNRMITWSDNDCAERLGAMLGWSKYNPTLKSYGFDKTKFAVPMQTSANNVALLYERLYNGTLLSPTSSNHFLDLLKAQRVNNRLPQGLPAGTVFAHKTGDLNGFVHDAGIVYGPKTDYIVVMASGPWASPGIAPAQFAAFSKQIYTQLSQ